ncbi:MAG: hypothetical protein IPL52_08905 [Flavobacteriales bacterium]|nr:hypothetical protein [Flavobacteriales bacterium]
MRLLLSIAMLCVLSTALLAQQQVFTSSGPFTVPAGVTSVTFELVGAGGNGASNGGGGGGGGGYARGTFNVTPGTTYSIVVGAGGSELATIVGGMGILAGAGENATTVPNPNIGGGGAGGVGLGGQLARTGAAGGGGYWTYFGGGGGGAAGPNANGTIGGNTIAYMPGGCLTPGGTGGSGGGAPAGDGGKGAGFIDNTCTAADPAEVGANYGGGGGGGNGNSSPAATGGGGICIITWNASTDIAPDEGTDLIFSTSFTDRIVPRNTTGSERYELLDAGGRIIWSGARIEQADFARLNAAAYILRMSAGDDLRVFRLVKAD